MRHFLLISTLIALLAPSTLSAQTVVIPKAGLLVAGETEGTFDCSASGRADCGDLGGDEDLDDDSGVGFGLDLLFHTGENMRMGLGVFYTPSTEYEDGKIQGIKLEKLGSDATINGILEFRVAKGHAADVFVRVEGGAAILIPGDDLEDLEDMLDDSCPDGTDCDLSSGPYLGWNAGVGIGAAFHVGSDLRLRADLVYRRTDITGTTWDIEGPGGSLETKITSVSDRTWMTLGVEF